MNFLRFAMLFSLQVMALSVWAQANASLTENQIKAAYLYKFAAYVEWPSTTFASIDSPISIGVVDADEVAAELQKIASERTLGDRVIKVKSLKSGEPLTDMQILYFGRRGVVQLKDLMSSVQVLPILTVTASPSALDAGSIINFVPVENHIRFEVSVAQAERSGLKISARLLALAQKVDGGRQ